METPKCFQKNETDNGPTKMDDDWVYPHDLGNLHMNGEGMMETCFLFVFPDFEVGGCPWHIVLVRPSIS